MTSEQQKQLINNAAEAFASQLGKCMTTFGLNWDTLGDPIVLGTQAAIDVTADYHKEVRRQRRENQVQANIDAYLVSAGT